MSAVGNIFDLVRGVKQRQENARIEQAVRENYMTDPMAAAKAVFEIDPAAGIKLQDDIRAQQEAQRKARAERLGGAWKYFRGLPEGTNYGQVIDGSSEMLKGLGLDDNDLTAMTQMASRPGFSPDMLNDDAYKAYIEDQYDSSVVTPGAHVVRGGKVVHKVPYKLDTVETKSGDGSSRRDVFDPNTGRFNEVPAEVAYSAPDAPQITPGSLDIDALRPHFIAQESGGDYTAVNETTGALGQRQVMPETGKALAKKLGLAWRPDMMKRDDPASQRYQQAIGDAALQESIEFGNGDPELIFAHYYGGPDKRQWGPKTRKYVSEMLQRTGTPATGSVVRVPDAGRAPIVTGAKPAKPTAGTVLSGEEAEALGFAPGSVVQQKPDGTYTVLQKPNQQQVKVDQRLLESGRQMVEAFTGLRGKAAGLLSSPGMNAAVGFIAGRVPAALLGQDAQNFVNDLDTLKRNIGLTALQSFKAMSTQGASGFGNLSNQEGDRLEQLFGTLERTSDEATIKKTLREIIRIADDKISNGSKTVRGWEANSGGNEDIEIGTIIRNPKTGARKRWSGNAWEDVR